MNLIYKKLLFLTFLLYLTLNFKIKVDQKSTQASEQLTIQKIPTYLGKSYHLAKGNPFSNKIDEGFKTTLFQFTYEKGLKTDDDKYTIPDNTHSTESTACSLDAKTQQYSGTTKYQQSLENTVSVDSNIPTPFATASFSMSTTFTQFSESTITKNRTVTQSNAECSAYVIEMPIFSNNIKMTEDFIDAVIQTTDSNNWDFFVNYFGTHYAYRVTFGGRYVYSHSYSAESMSYFKSKGLEISIAAKVQFANKFGISMSDDLKKYQSQTNAIDTKVEQTKSSIIGGEPQKGGNWIDWQKTVKTSLAPISYELISISNLFHFIPKLNATEATTSFNSYLQKYCVLKKCPPLHPDRPDPKPLLVSFTTTSQVKNTITNNKFDTNDHQVKVGMRVYRVLIGSQGDIDSVQFFLTDGITEHALPVAGNRQFNHEYKVPENDEIECVRFGIHYSNFGYYQFGSLQFVTKNKKQSQVYKGSNSVNEYRVLCLASKDDHFIGFYGHYGWTFNGIGLNVMKQVYQP